MKRTLAMILAFVLAFSVIMPTSTVNANSTKHTEAGNLLKDLGVLQGSKSGDLMLDNNFSREQMVVMISRLYNEEDTAKKFSGDNIFKDLTRDDQFYIPYVLWSVNKGLIDGYTDKTFRPKNQTTVQQYQKVLLIALGYSEASEHWDMVPEWAAKYGLMKNVSASSGKALTRGEMAAMTLNTLGQEINGKDITLAEHLNVKIPGTFKIKSTSQVDNNTLVVEGSVTGGDDKNIILNLTSSSLGVYIPRTLTPDKDGNFIEKFENLEAGDYLYRFQSDSQYTEYKDIRIDVVPFALKDISANNLKEIHLKFTQAVDKTIASLPINYDTTAGSIKDIRFEDKDTKIILTLNGTMSQQTKYKLSARKIKSAGGEEKTIDDYEFEALDIEAPKMISYNQLGDIGLRIYFSEPIKTAKASNFKIDGKDFFGRLEHENNIVTLLYSSSSKALKEGTHSLIISGIEDYFGYKPAENNHQITIAKDTSTFKIVDSSASLDRVIIEFNKDIYPGSASNKSFFWKSGTSKRYASKVTVNGNQAIVDFTTNTLSPNENIIYVENVVDYFGNKATDSTKVVPVIDTTSPEVISYYLSKDGQSITVYYSKNVTGNNRKDYTILDENNKSINIRDIQGSGAEYKLNLYAPLPVGYNSFIIDGVKDTTTLKNSLVPFNDIIEMKDIERPKIISSTGYGNNILIHFSKVMDMSTVANPSNYIMKFKGQENYLPSNTSFSPSDDGKSITIVLPETYDGDKIAIGLSNNLTELQITRLKDIVGNDTDPIITNIKFDGTSTGNAKAVDYYNTRPGRQGVLLESNLIKVRFNIPVVQASGDDFALDGRKISHAIADGTTEVSIYLEDTGETSLPTGSLRVLAKNNMKTSINTGVDNSIIQILDEIAPKIKYNTEDLTVYGNQIELPFTEALEDEGSSLYRRDLEIVRLADNTILGEDDYTTRLNPSDKSILIISINNRTLASRYSVRLAGRHNDDQLSYIMDRDGNLAEPSNIYITDRDIYK